MLNDIKVIIDDEQIEYTYEVTDDEITFKVPIDQECEKIELFYDENIYENISGSSFQIISVDKVSFDLDNVQNKTLTFKLEVNYKYFIKMIYKYLNEFIDKNGLLEELELFKKTKVGKEYQKELESLIGEIEEKSLDDLLLADVDEHERIENILLNNKLYISLADKMTSLDLMLLITNYISCGVVFKIEQDTFDDLVKTAANYDHALENVWRLGMNYDGRGYNFDLLDKFFVEKRDAWYLSEYISSVCQVDQEKIVNLIIATKDKEFIQKLLNDNFIQNHLKEEYQQILKDTL